MKSVTLRYLDATATRKTSPGEAFFRADRAMFSVPKFDLGRFHLTQQSRCRFCCLNLTHIIKRRGETAEVYHLRDFCFGIDALCVEREQWQVFTILRRHWLLTLLSTVWFALNLLRRIVMHELR